jgi:hypothetical protein
MSTQSAKPSDFSVGLTHKFVQAFLKMGGTPETLNDLREDPEKMRKVAGIAHNFCDPGPLRATVNLSGDAYLPHAGWSIVTNKQMGQVELVFQENRLSMDGRLVTLSKRDHVRNSHPDHEHFNGAMLRFLLNHPEFHPPAWKGKYVSFWGTHYRSPNGREAIFCIHKEKSFYEWDWINPKTQDVSQSPAAVII